MGEREGDNQERGLTNTGTTSMHTVNTSMNKTVTAANSILEILKKKEDEEKLEQEKAQQEQEKEANLAMMKTITKQFKAHYITTVKNNPDWFHIRTAEGSYIITKEGKVLAGPHQEPKSNNVLYTGYMHECHLDGIRREGHLILTVCLPDQTLETLHVTAERIVHLPHYRNINPLRQEGEQWEYLVQEQNQSYIIDEKANRISDLYNHIGYNASTDTVTGSESAPRKLGIVGYSGLLIKNEYGKYEHQGMHIYSHDYPDGRRLCRGDRTTHDIGLLYDKDGKLVMEGAMLPIDGHSCGIELFPLGNGKYMFVEESGTRTFDNIKEFIYPKFRIDYFDDGEWLMPIIITNDDRVMAYDRTSHEIVDPTSLRMTPLFGGKFRKYDTGDDQHIITDETNKVVDKGHFEFFTYNENLLGGDTKEMYAPNVIKKIVVRTYNHPEGRKSKYVIYNSAMQAMPEIYDEFRSYDGGDCVIAEQEGRYCLVNLALEGKKVSDLYFNVVPFQGNRFQAVIKDEIKSASSQERYLPRGGHVLLDTMGNVIMGPFDCIHQVNDLMIEIGETADSESYYTFLDGTRIGE